MYFDFDFEAYPGHNFQCIPQLWTDTGSYDNIKSIKHIYGNPVWGVLILLCTNLVLYSAFCVHRYLFSTSYALVRYTNLLSAWNRVSANIVNALSVVSFAHLWLWSGSPRSEFCAHGAQPLAVPFLLMGLLYNSWNQGILEPLLLYVNVSVS
jgi:hypothetical protein